MMVNGLVIPAALVEALESGRLQRERGSWQLREDRDAYGQPLETELGHAYETAEEMAAETATLAPDYPENEHYGPASPQSDEPGAIPDIVDFSQIVCFGISGDGAPFCLDYRDSADRPSVIWWDDVYWRRVAPDVESFFGLLDFEAK